MRILQEKKNCITLTKLSQSKKKNVVAFGFKNTSIVSDVLFGTLLPTGIASIKQKSLPISTALEYQEYFPPSSIHLLLKSRLRIGEEVELFYHHYSEEFPQLY